jgi:hypothetical protein
MGNSGRRNLRKALDEVGIKLSSDLENEIKNSSKGPDELCIQIINNNRIIFESAPSETIGKIYQSLKLISSEKEPALC